MREQPNRIVTRSDRSSNAATPNRPTGFAAGSGIKRGVG
jgi:hypothetical protein